MQENNTIKARHFNIVDGNIRLRGKEYYWHIPKTLRAANIQKGDIVVVRDIGRKAKVVVIDVLRENIEETGKKYEVVLSKVRSKAKDITVENYAEWVNEKAEESESEKNLSE